MEFQADEKYVYVCETDMSLVESFDEFSISITK